MDMILPYLILIVSGLMIVITLKRKQYKTFVVVMIPLYLSLWNLYKFAESNIFSDPCAGVPDCMNETGMYLMFSLIFMAVAIAFHSISSMVITAQSK